MTRPDNLPPHDLDAEAGVIAGLTLYGEAVRSMTEVLGAEDFYNTAHASVWTECLDLLTRGVRPSFELLRLALPDLAKEFLLDLTLTSRVGSEAIVRHQAVRVAELAARRRLLVVGHELVRGAKEIGSDLDIVKAEAVDGIGQSGSPIAVIPPGPDLMEFFELVEEAPMWVAPDMIGRGDRVLLIGEEGLGKSTVLRQVCVQVACGLYPFSEDRPIPPLPTMLVDGENPAYEVQRALRTMYQAAGARLDPTMMTVHTKPEGVDLLNRGDRRWLVERLAANRPALLALGPLYKLHNQEPSDERPARQVSAILDDLRTRYNCALLLEGHAPHAVAGRARHIRPYGASLWMRWPDQGPSLLKETTDGGEDIWRFGTWRPSRGIRTWPRTITSGGSWPWLAPSLRSTPTRREPPPELLPGPETEGTRHARY